jgi:fluoride ion exporter CrcB/FEX
MSTGQNPPFLRPQDDPSRVGIPITSDAAFWASMMLSWVAQSLDHLLEVDKWAVNLTAVAGIGLIGITIFKGLERPLPTGMRLPRFQAWLMLAVMIAVTVAWVWFGLIYTRDLPARLVYGVCASLTAWSAFVTYRALTASPAKPDDL